MVSYLRRLCLWQYRPWVGSGAVLVGVRRFPLFLFEIVMHLVDTAPNDFRL